MSSSQTWGSCLAEACCRMGGLHLLLPCVAIWLLTVFCIFGELTWEPNTTYAENMCVVALDLCAATRATGGDKGGLPSFFPIAADGCGLPAMTT